jgi:hypothetical protein
MVRIAVVEAVISVDILTAGAGVWDGTKPNKDAVVDHLQRALEPVNGAARVYAVVKCPRKGLDAEFAGVKMQMPTKRKNLFHRSGLYGL